MPEVENVLRDAARSRNHFVCSMSGKVPTRVLTDERCSYQFFLKLLSRYKEVCCWKPEGTTLSHTLFIKHLRVSPEVGTSYIYKCLHIQVPLPVEERAWQIRVPVPITKGGRQSLKVTENAEAISKAKQMVLELRV